MARKDSLYRDSERESNKNSKKMARKDTVYRDKERESNKKSMQMARKDQAYRDTERECNKKSMQMARKDQGYRDNERECNKKSMQMARKDQAYRDIDRERNKKSKNMTRKDPLYRDIERDCDKKSKEMARENPWYRDNERECNKMHMNMARIDPVYRQNEQQCDTNRKKSLRKKQLSLDDLIKNFHSEVEKGPVHKCCICDQLWYRHSVIIVRNSSLPDCPALHACMSDMKQSERDKLICKTCISHLKKKKIPPRSTANGMGFPEIPQQLQDLHQVEWRLVSPRIPFMKVFAAPRGGQKKIRGNVVNVPCDTVNTFQVLPHSGNEHQTIQVKIKRDLKYTNHVMSENVRPYKVREAAEYLVTHGKLFKDQGIVFDMNWEAGNDERDNDSEINRDPLLFRDTDVPAPDIESRVNNIPNEPQPGCSHWNDSLNDSNKGCESDENDTCNREGQIEFGVTIRGGEIEIDLEPENVHTTHECQQKEGPISKRGKQDQIAENDDELWSENEDDNDENHSGVLDTMLTSPDFLEDEERELQYILAPGQGRTPVSVFKDKYSEELAYPNIYCGQSRLDSKSRKVPVYYSEICKSELRHQDRRVAQDPDNLFFKTKKLQMKMMLDKVQIAMRKCKCKDLSLKAGSLKDPFMINDIVFKDIGYKLLNTVRGSPPYFQAVAKDLFAMIPDGNTCLKYWGK